MHASLTFLLGLFERGSPACAAAEDFRGPHARLLRLLQRGRLADAVPGANPVPSCPYCGEGVPYRLGARYVCGRCASAVGSEHLLLWQVNLRAFLTWLVRRLGLRGDIQSFEGRLWQLGTWEADGSARECFYWRCGPVPEAGLRRLQSYRNVVVFYGLSPPATDVVAKGQRVSLLEVLRLKRSLSVTALPEVVDRGGVVRFDADSGAVLAGGTILGEVPLGSKEHHLLACLSQPLHLDHYVPYSDIKHYVLQQSGSTDSTEEATFCQRLKHRCKKWVPKIDLLIATTNKADGYRLRGRLPGEP